MPPQNRTRATKILKENIDVVQKNKLKSDGKISKPPRKALADKTNSLSDDNASIDVPVKTAKKLLGSKSKTNADVSRPRRDRRLPPRYIENETLTNLSNNKESPIKQGLVTFKAKTQNKKITKLDPKSTQSHHKNTSTSAISAPEVKVIATLPKKLPKSKEAPSQPSKQAKTNDKQVPIIKYLTNNENEVATTRSKINQKTESIKQSIIQESQDSDASSSLFKSPANQLESSLVANRPKRIHRLPSRFEDHSISPNKFIPVQPCHASTPIQEKNTKTLIDNKSGTTLNEKNNAKSSKTTEKPVTKIALKYKFTKAAKKINSSNSSLDKTSPDSNNNGKNKTRPKRAIVRAKLQTKQGSPKTNKITPFAKRLLNNSLSFRVLEDRKSDVKDDVYEFTFDPNEEPTPQKKKRKRPVKKRLPKTKNVVLKSNYDDNVSKALETLKNRVKPSQSKSVQNSVQPQTVKPTEKDVIAPKSQSNTVDNKVTAHQNPMPSNHAKHVENQVKPVKNVQSTQNIAKITNNLPQGNYSTNITPALPPNYTATSIHASNYASICVEDIAADFELSQNDINYSPVNSPHPQSFEAQQTHQETNSVINNDPLNLQEGTSFFEEPPVASSSMNMSVRQPLASPWRVEFGSLPMKWRNNTYVKPNMTPAVESSFVTSEESAKKKHVYTNMLPDEPLPEIFGNPSPALKQTSIISFYKEVADRQNKKKRRRSPSPVKTNSIFEDINTTTASDFGQKTPKKAKTAKESTPNKSNNSNTSKDKENSANSSDKSLSPQKRQKKKDKDLTYFGFDESENIDQENVSPQKQNKTTKTRTLRSRMALQEMNAQPLPTRAVLPVNPKSKLPSSEVVEQMYDQLKSTEDAQFPGAENAKEPNTVATDLDGQSIFEDNDSQSVHLFEDIEVVHHFKPPRKSYGKSKKVTFIQTENSDSDSQSWQGQPVTVDPDRSSDEDDLADLTFHIPDIKQKKPVKKKKAKKLLTKKEEKAVEEWAAGFNSMCEDIDEFPLLVE